MRRAALTLPGIVVALVGVLVSPMPAGAHIAQSQEGRAPFLVDGAVRGGLSTWGIVLPAGDGYERVCEEALGTTVFFATQELDGSVVVGTRSGMRRTVDGGCTLEPVHPALDDALPTAWVNASGQELVATGQLDVPGGIYALDAIREEPLLGPLEGTSFFQLVASRDGESIVATGIRVSGATSVPAVFFSDNGGVSFEDASSEYVSFLVVRAVSFREDDRGVLFSAVLSTNAGAVVTGSLTTPRSVMATLPTEPRAAVEWRGAVYATTPLSGEMRRLDAGASSFVVVTDVHSGPTQCLFVHPSGDKLVGCGREQVDNPGMFLESNDGVSWTELVAFSDVRYRSCPVESTGFAACSRFFESSCDNGVDDDTDGLTDCDDDECSCVDRPPLEAAPSCAQADATPAMLGALLLLGAMLRAWRRVPRRAECRRGRSPSP